MSWFSALKPESLHDLLVHEVKATIDVEERVLDALPDMRDSASDPELKRLFDAHLAETRQQVTRLEEVCRALGVAYEADTCAAMRGIVSDGKVVQNMGGDPACRDAGLIMAAQTVEHLEICRYGTLKTWARILGRDDLAEIFRQSQKEEEAMDQRLTDLADASVNQAAAR